MTRHPRVLVRRAGGVGGVLGKCFTNTAGVQWEPWKGQTFRRSSKVQTFNGVKDTQLSPIATCWPAMIRAWGNQPCWKWGPDGLLCSITTLARQWDIAQTQQSFACKQVLAQGFSEGSPPLTPTFLLYPLWQIHFLPFTWCNLTQTDCSHLFFDHSLGYRTV